jgi:hypothetical protein
MAIRHFLIKQQAVKLYVAAIKRAANAALK